MNENHRQEKEEKWTKIWRGNWWPKIAAFCWLVIKRRILTWDNIQKRGLAGPSRCSLCKKSNETINHLLDECSIASNIWDKGSRLFKNNSRKEGRPNITIAEWPKKRFKNKILNRIWELYPRFMVWEIWKTSNQFFLENMKCKTKELWEIMGAHIKETIKLRPWWA